MPKKHLYLPKILSGANIDEPVSNAVWEDKQKKIVLAISDGIEIDDTVQTRGVSSIPDIYARPLTFLSAIRSEKHPLRKRIIQEWRGLLSLLALHKVKSDLGNVTITPVNLHGDTFSTALKNLAPRNIKLQKNGIEYSWTDILLIRFGDIPLGSFSPATLVYTSADYSTTLKNTTFSLKDSFGFLKPPGKAEGLEYVGEWLEWFIREFNRHALTSSDPTGDHKYVGDLNKLLDSWLVEIKGELGIGVNTPIDATRVRIAGEPIDLVTPSSFLAKYEIYKALLTPLVKDEAAAEAGNKSEYSLKMSRNQSGYREIVLINAQLLTQDRILWDETRPSELGDTTSLIEKFFTVPSGNRINNINLVNDNSIWVRPELFFLSNTLLKASTGDILNDKEAFLNAGTIKYIMPFNENILKVFSPIDILETLKPRFHEADGKVTFSFSLPLQNNRHAEVRKVYRSKGSNTDGTEGQIQEIDVPVLEIFPNYLGDFWCQYFMLCSNTDTFHMDPVNFENHIATTRKEQTFETTDSRKKAEIIRISGYNSFPEGIVLRPKKSISEGYGLILLNKDPDVEGRPFNGSVRVGIDFGTSNTNIFRYSNENANRWTFSFSKYLRSVLRATESERNLFTHLFFVPTKDQQLPIPTALRVFKAGVTDNVILDQFIYFPDKYQYPDNVYTEIKWDDDNTKLNSFLRSLALLLIVDLMHDRVGKIEFRCSYPKSFSDDRINAYKRAWKETLEGFFHKEAENPVIAPGQFIFVGRKKGEESDDEYTVATKNNGKFTISLKPVFITEGIAAGEYFSSQYIITDGVSYANKEDGAVCIDVGGATSDYSVWFGSKIRLDASVILAGKQISRLLKNNSRVSDILFSSEAVSALNDVRDNDILFSSRLNFVLRREEKAISSKLSSNANNRDIAWLRRIIALEFGALSFYAAHLCLALDEFLEKKLSERVKENGIKLHWGGNASKFINWIDYGRYERDGVASKFLNGMFVNTIMDKSIGERAFRPALLGQVQSPGHKDEASGGLVVMNVWEPEHHSAAQSFDELLVDVEPANQEILNGLIVGDRVIVNGQKYEHYNVINKDTFFVDNTSNFTATEISQFERFVLLVNQVGKITGLFPEGSQINLSFEEKQSIKQRVKNDIAALARLKPDARTVEPVFIMEVKYLFDILSHKMK